MDISVSYNVFDHSSVYFNVSNALGSAQHQYVYNPIYSLYYAKIQPVWNSVSDLPFNWLNMVPVYDVLAPYIRQMAERWYIR
jgi:hypothetical protein